MRDKLQRNRIPLGKDGVGEAWEQGVDKRDGGWAWA